MEHEQFYAGGFLYNPKVNEVFLHLRDSNTDYDPNLWAFFGGMNEAGETPAECFVRELEEETTLKIAPQQAVWLCDYLHVEYDLYRYVFYVESEVNREQLRLTEGADFDWFSLQDVEGQNLADKARSDLMLFKRKIRKA